MLKICKLLTTASLYLSLNHLCLHIYYIPTLILLIKKFYTTEYSQLYTLLYFIKDLLYGYKEYFTVLMSKAAYKFISKAYITNILKLGIFN